MISVLALALCTASADPTGEGIRSRIHRQPVSSSVLASVGYSKHLHALEVEFKTGAIYRYLEVPKQVYDELMSAPSKAAYYDAKVRHQYSSRHVRPSTD